MPDLVLKAGLVSSTADTLSRVTELPGMTIKGRYAMAKALDAIGPAATRYQKEKLALLKAHAKKDEHDIPITQTVGNVMSFDFGEGFSIVPPDVQAELDEMNDEDVTLSGVRQITHAELNACPITAAQESVLIKAGLLEDKEPE